MKQAKTYTRYAAWIAGLLFLALATTSGALFFLRSALNEQHEKIVDYTRSLIPAERMRSALQTYVASDRGFLITGSPEFLERVHLSNEEFERSLGQIEAHVKSDEGKRLIEEIYVLKQQHERLVFKMMSNREKSGITRQVRAFFKDKVFPSRLALQAAVDQLVSYKENELLRVETEARSESDWAVRVISLLSLTAMLLLVALCVILTRHLSRLYANAERLNEEYRNMADELERSNSELEHFATVASHDMRSPLNTISSFGALLEEKLAETPDSETHLYLSFMVKSATKLRGMVDDLLDYARVSGGPTKLMGVELSSVVKEASALLQDDIESAGGQISCSPLPSVYGHQSQLTQVFQNIFSNSLKYRSETPPNIRVFARLIGSDWLIVIEDNGLGIPESELEEVFHPFKRLHAYHERPGTGLGLPICRKIIERHGGKIWLESEPGKGTKCFIRLPKLRDRIRDLPTPEPRRLGEEKDGKGIPL